MIKHTFYIIYNVIYQLFSFWFMVFFGVYYNGELIPESLQWTSNRPRTDVAGLTGAAVIQGLLLIIEAAILILFIYFVNRLILSDTEDIERIKTIANKTAKINIIASACFIASLLLVSFKH